MSHSAKASAIEIEAETLFCEATPSTTATYRLPIIGPVDVSGLKRPKIDSGRAMQYRNAGSKFIDGPYSGTIKTKFHWFGHGSSTLGATTVNAHETLLGNILGVAPSASIATGTTFTTGGTAAAPTTTVANGFAAGSIGFAGALGDARAKGQAFVVGAHATNILTLLTALPGAPINGDVCRSAVMFYPPETPTTTSIVSYRMRLLSANLRYLVRGAFPVGWTVGGTNAGEQPHIEVTWEVAYFVEQASGDAPFPSTVATNTSNPATIAGGSVFINDVGTATRVELDVRNFTIDYTLAVETLRGPGGNFALQDIIGARRKNDACKISFTVDADAATATPALVALFNSTTPKHILWTGSTTNGSAIAMYAPNVEPCGEYPVQKIDGEMNRLSFEGMCFTGQTTTNDLTLSMVRFANG
jgi:hypothetical protein